jgi:hypothetical protein
MAADLLTVPRILSVADRVPAALGVNARMIVQLPPGATVPLLVQVPPVRAKSEEFVPVMVKNVEARFSLAVPLLAMVTVSPELVEPTF